MGWIGIMNKRMSSLYILHFTSHFILMNSFHSKGQLSFYTKIQPLNFLYFWYYWATSDYPYIESYWNVSKIATSRRRQQPLYASPILSPNRLLTKEIIIWQTCLLVPQFKEVSSLSSQVSSLWEQISRQVPSPLTLPTRVATQNVLVITRAANRYCIFIRSLLVVARYWFILAINRSCQIKWW